jgi:hypothetical protein
VQQLNTQHIFHPLTQNSIITFKSRAQAIFSLSEKTPPPWFTKFVFEKFFSLFYIISIRIYQKMDTNSCFAKLRAISNLFSFFLYTLNIKNWILIAVLRNWELFQGCSGVFFYTPCAVLTVQFIDIVNSDRELWKQLKCIWHEFLIFLHERTL